MGYPFALPELGYAYDALEPHIDARTMEIHHGKHHAGYTSKLNSALEGHSALHGKSAEALLADLGSVPEAIRTAVRNNGGGYVNHALFWDIMRPGGADAPSGDLASAIDGAFGLLRRVQGEAPGCGRRSVRLGLGLAGRGRQRWPEGPIHSEPGLAHLAGHDAHPGRGRLEHAY